MTYFTHERLNPSERTLELIKQIAYTYRVVKISGDKFVPYCLN